MSTNPSPLSGVSPWDNQDQGDKTPHDDDKTRLDLCHKSLLCQRCQRLDFRYLGDKEWHFAADTLEQNFRRSAFYTLHNSEESFRSSLVSGCHLCNLLEVNSKYTFKNGDAFTCAKGMCQAAGVYMLLVKIDEPNQQPNNAIPSSFSVLVLSADGKMFPLNAQTDKTNAYLSPSVAWPMDLTESIKRDSFQLCGGERHPCRHRPTKAHHVEEQDNVLPKIPCTATLCRCNYLDICTGSAVNVELALNLLKRCRKHHTKCIETLSHAHPSRRPRRLIDVSDYQSPCVIELCEKGTSEDCYSYVALSYRWPDKNDAKLEKKRLQDRVYRLKLTEHPGVIIDAIYFARELGFKYLWVDALCIVQDDPVDVEYSLGMMADIYRGAELTICGSAGRSDGLFYERNPRWLRPCVVDVRLHLGKILDFSALIGFERDQEPGELSQRGWVLQEESLSLRILRFGKEEMSWNCLSSRNSESAPGPGGNPYYGADHRFSSLDDLKKTALDTTRNKLPIYYEFGQSVWERTVDIFSDRFLTEQTDKLNALAGVAASIARNTDRSYRAGLWEDELPESLLWYSKEINQSSKLDTYPLRQACAPSWSWASLSNTNISHRLPGWRNDDAKRQQVFTQNLKYMPQDIRVTCSADQSNNRFGSTSGEMTITACTKRARLVVASKEGKRLNPQTRLDTTYNKMQDLDIFMLWTGHPRFPARLMDTQGPNIIGHAALDLPIEPEIYQFVDVLFVTVCDKDKKENSICLLLTPLLGNSSTFHRIGLGVLYGKDWFNPTGTTKEGEQLDKLLHHPLKRTITLV